jgi:SH3-like domain-containing protein
MGGQGEAQQLVIARDRLPSSKAPAILLACVLAAGAQAAAAAPVDRSTPSGMPVPRYVSLKFDKVNARAGPGDDHRLLWVYTVRGLPLQVIAETSEWRRVCGPDGTLAWVHKRTIDGRRTVINTEAQAVTLLRKPKPDAKPVAYLNARAMASLVRCDKGWCRVKVDGVSGWAAEGTLWGTSDALQCH